VNCDQCYSVHSISPFQVEMDLHLVDNRVISVVLVTEVIKLQLRSAAQRHHLIAGVGDCCGVRNLLNYVIMYHRYCYL